MFKQAVKRDAKLRLALSGPAGAGKTFSLLVLATELANGGKIAYIDTEHGSASKYAHTDKCGGPNCTDPSHFNFEVVEPESFDPRQLIKFIDYAVEHGYAVICVDSLSHYWMGPNGELELVDAAAKRDTRGNSFAAWKTITPIHNQLVDRILSVPIHVMVSMRTKTEWVVEKDEKTGKSVPRKIGLAPVMRDGIEFEFDVCGDLDQDNNLTITKTRCSALSGKVINRPGREMANVLREWCAGAPNEAKAETSSSEAVATPASAKEGGGSGAAPSSSAAKDFELLKNFSTIKGDLRKATDGDETYYTILGAHGYEHSDQIPSREVARPIFIELRQALKDAIDKVTEAA